VAIDFVANGMPLRLSLQ